MPLENGEPRTILVPRLAAADTWDSWRPSCRRRCSTVQPRPPTPATGRATPSAQPDFQTKHFPLFLKGPSREILNLWRFQYIKPTQNSDLLTKMFCNLHGFEIAKKFKFFLTAPFLESRSRNDSNTSHFYTNSFQIPYRVPSRPRASSQSGLICGRLQQQKLKPNVLLDPLNPKNSVE